MKKLISSLILLAVCAGAYAQDAQQAAMDAANTVNNTAAPAAPAPKPNYWNLGLGIDLGFNQASQVNWAAGGYATIGLAAALDGKANYAKGLMKWDNRLQLNYGFVWSADKPNLVQSSNDRIYLESKWAYNMSEKSKWAYSAGLDFRTQFSDTRDNYHQEDPTNPKSKWLGDLKSTFLSPAYLNLALGIDWDPNEWFDLSIAPLTGSLVAVVNEDLRKSYGMAKDRDIVYMDPTHPLFGTTKELFKAYKLQLGTQIKANVKVAVNNWFAYETQLVVFGNYLGKNYTTTYLNEEGHPVNYKVNDIVRVNWDNKITFNVAKYFKVGLQTWLIYDPSIVFKKAEFTYKARPVQFKEAVSINFTYTIASKKN